MRLNRSTIGILVVSVLVIAAALILTNNANAPGSDTDEADAAPTVESITGPVFPEVTQEAVVLFEVRDNETENFTRLSKDDADLWVLESSAEEEGREVDQGSTASSLGALAALSSNDGFTTDDLAQFGLDAPRYTLSMTTEDGTTHSLLIGNQNPSGNRYYGMIEGDTSTVYQFATFTIDDLVGLASAPPYATEEPSTIQPPQAPGPVFPGMSVADVTRFEIMETATGETTVITRRQDNFWELGEATTNTQDLDVDQDGITANLQTLFTLQTVDSFAVEDLAEFGLDEPDYTLTLTSFDNSVRSLALGDTISGGARTYATVNGDEATVYVLGDRELIDGLIGLIEQPPYLPPEATPEVTPEATAEMTPDAEMTPEVTPEATAEAE